MNKNDICTKLRKTYPHASADWIGIIAEELCNVAPALQTNVEEWLADKPFTDIPIHGKYSLRDVLDLRGSRDVPAALIALNLYAADPAQESVLYPWTV